jgi:hypothetical protein
MFERNKIDNSEQGTIVVSITFTDGSTQVGKVLLPIGRSLGDLINNGQLFIEFEPYGEERAFVAKSRIVLIKAVSPGKPVNLQNKLRELDGFNPHDILGVAPETPWDQIKPAYFRLAKTYHPDRYATAELPEEVTTYLQAMARRVNVAYTTLEAKHVVRKEAQSLRQAPIYVSTGRGA